MRILFLATDLFDSQGGIQIFNNYFVNALVKLGQTLSVISINDIKSPDDINYLFSPVAKFRPFKDIVFPITAFKQIFCFKPDLIICGHINFSLLCMIMSAIFKIPYFTIVYGVEAWSLNRLEISGIKHSKKILSVSSFTKNKILMQLSDYKKCDVFILPSTFDEQRFRPKPKPKYLMDKFNLKEDDKLLLTIARLSKGEKYKGYDKVIVAMKEIIKEIPNVKYLLVGSGDDEDRIKTLIKDSGLEDRVILTGFVPSEEVVDYYNLCEVFVMPSIGEGFGIVFLEALACGKPVIAGNKDGSREALLDGKLGLLVNPDDTSQIAEAIIKILKGDVDRYLLDADFLRQSAIEHFGLECFYQRVAELINFIE